MRSLRLGFPKNQLGFAQNPVWHLGFRNSWFSSFVVCQVRVWFLFSANLCPVFQLHGFLYHKFESIFGSYSVTSQFQFQPNFSASQISDFAIQSVNFHFGLAFLLHNFLFRDFLVLVLVRFCTYSSLGLLRIGSLSFLRIAHKIELYDFLDY